jgi:hypothetical protein
MNQEFIGVLLDQAPLTLDEVSISCQVSHEWIIERG